MPAAPVMRGTVVRLEGRKPLVEVPDLGVGYAFGPCETTTGLPLDVGDRVLVVSVGGVTEDVVVIGKLDPTEPRLFVQATAPTAAQTAGITRWVWWDTSGAQDTVWVEDGEP